MFLLVSGGHIGVPERDTNMAFPCKSFINLGKPFFPISRIWNVSQTWFLARVFVYLSFFISQILVLLHWMVCFFCIFHCVTVLAENRGSPRGSRTQQLAYCLRYAHSRHIESHLGKKQQQARLPIAFLFSQLHFNNVTHMLFFTAVTLLCAVRGAQCKTMESP